MMEDLSEKATTTIGVFRSVSAEQCLNFARHFAEFQAHVELLDEKDWHGKFLRNIYMRQDLAEEEKRGIYPALDYKNGEIRQQIQQFLDMDIYKFACFTVKDKAKEYDAITLCHGDSWTNNTLIRVNEDGSIGDDFAAFIDWQTFFEGSALHDLARFIVDCAGGEIRRVVQEKAVDLYYDCLSQRLEKFGKKVRFTREQAHELYKLAAVQQTQTLIKTFTYWALPLIKTGNPWDQAKIEKIWLRLKLALEDAQPTIDKYDMLNKFSK